MADRFFDIKEAISDWGKNLDSSKGLTDSDIEELKAHLEDEYNSVLDEKDITGEEAFMIASGRVGYVQDWGDEFTECNKRSFELRNVAIVCSGVLVYLFAYYLIRLIVAAVYIINIRSGYDLLKATTISRLVVYGFLIIFTVLIINLFLKNDEFLSGLIDRLGLNARTLLKIAIATMILGIFNHMSLPMLEKYTVMAGGSNVLKYYFLIRHFEYIFLVQITITFILIYFKVIRKSEPPA